MNKAVSPEQLELVKEMSREEMILATAPHIDPDSAALKADADKILKIAIAEAATAVLASAHDVEFDDFNWSTDPSVIIQEQRATAVYRNPAGGLVIRQERTWDEESDPFVVVSESNSIIFMEALARRARE
jgi:hypothetical protein